MATDIRMTPKEFIVRDGGEYPGVLVDIELGQREDYNDKTKKVPCIDFHILPDADKDKPEDEQQTILIRTGANFGNQKAGATKVVNSIVGRPVTPGEVKRLNLCKLIGQRVAPMLTKEAGTEGGEVNKVVGLNRIDKKPLELEPLLDPEG